MAFKKKKKDSGVVKNLNDIVKISKEVIDHSYQKIVDRDWSEESEDFYNNSSSSGDSTIFKSENLEDVDQEPEQLDIEKEIKNLDTPQETLEKNDNLNQRVDIFFEKVKDFIEDKSVDGEISPFLNAGEKDILDDIKKVKNKVAGSFFDTKQLLIDVKKYLRDSILESPNNLKTKDLILELGKLLNEFFDETAKTTTSMTVITSLVPYEEPKQESKKEEVKEEPKQKPRQLSMWSEVFYTTEEIKTATVQNYEDENLTFKVTIESPKYADPFIVIKGKIFTDDIRIVNDFLAKFKQLALKE